MLAVVKALTKVAKSGKNLIITGTGFVDGAKVLINGEAKKTTDVTVTGLTGKKAARGIQAGARIQVRNPDGSLSNEWTYP